MSDDFMKYDAPFAKAVAAAVQADYLAMPDLDLAVVTRRLDAKGLANIMTRDLERSVTNPGQRALFPALRRVMKSQMSIEEAKLRSGSMGQWAELATAIAGAAGSIVNTRTVSQTNETLAKLDLQKQQLALQAAQFQANAAQIQLATAQGFPAPGSAAAALGVPNWVIPASIGGVAAVGLIAYLMTRGKRRGR